MLGAAGAGLHGVFAAWYGGDLWFFLGRTGRAGRQGRRSGEPPCASTCVTAVAGPAAGAAAALCHPADALQISTAATGISATATTTASARGLAGVFFAWGWLRHDRKLRAYRLGGPGRAGDLHLQGPRQPRGVRRHGGAVSCCSAVQKFAAETVRQQNLGTRCALAAARRRWRCSASTPGTSTTPSGPTTAWRLLLLSIALSGRFEIWHNVFWGAPPHPAGRPAH